jgi:hypothetical protein
MKHIVLTTEQAQVVREAGEAIEVRDECGRTVAHLAPLPAADIEAIERSKRLRGKLGPRVPSHEVQSHLRRLGELRQAQDMDETKMLDLLHRLRAGEQV